MQTPAGNECKFFYGDYFRGRHQEECRLLKDANLDWRPDMCEKCPIPDILLANSCEHMEFRPNLYRPYLILSHQVEIKTYCNKSASNVDEPRIGCGQCHPLLDTFVIAPDENNPAA
jgi:hypothetical protein